MTQGKDIGVDREAIAKSGSCSLEIAQALIDGVDKESLHQLIQAWTRVSRDSGAIPYTRMTIVGKLRKAGYEVQGGTEGRWMPYKVLGKKAPGSGQPIEGSHWYRNSPVLSPDSDSFEWWKHTRTEPNTCRPEDFWTYPFYEAGKDKAYRVDTSTILYEKFPKKPRFRLLSLSLTDPEALFGTVKELRKSSVMPVEILGLAGNELPWFLMRGYKVRSVNRYSIVGVDHAIKHWDNVLTRTGRDMLQKAAQYVSIEPTSDLATIRSAFDLCWMNLDDTNRVVRHFQELNTLAASTYSSYSVILVATKKRLPVGVAVVDLSSNNELAFLPVCRGLDLEPGTSLLVLREALSILKANGITSVLIPGTSVFETYFVQQNSIKVS